MKHQSCAGWLGRMAESNDWRMLGLGRMAESNVGRC